MALGICHLTQLYFCQLTCYLKKNRIDFKDKKDFKVHLVKWHPGKQYSTDYKFYTRSHNESNGSIENSIILITEIMTRVWFFVTIPPKSIGC